MNNLYQRTYHIKANIDLLKTIIQENQDNFLCPFQNVESYLHIYKNDKCKVQFFNLQDCDYSKEKNKEGILYIKYLMSNMLKAKRLNDYNYLKENFEKFCIETNEENFIKDISNNDLVRKLLKNLKELWCYDHSNPLVKICRARIVRLPAYTEMPFHRDETSSKNLRIICPIVTNDKCINAFRISSDNIIEKHFPANGAFYTFYDEKIEHAVFNNSNEDRYALIFTVTGIRDLKVWDRGYYKNQIFWKNWGKL